jgi:Cu/Zn superoxide dismutase
VGPLPSAKHKWHIDNALDAKITAGVVHNGERGFHIHMYGSVASRLAKVIGFLPI